MARSLHHQMDLDTETGKDNHNYPPLEDAAYCREDLREELHHDAYEYLNVHG